MVLIIITTGAAGGILTENTTILTIRAMRRRMVHMPVGCSRMTIQLTPACWKKTACCTTMWTVGPQLAVCLRLTDITQRQLHLPSHIDVVFCLFLYGDYT